MLPHRLYCSACAGLRLLGVAVQHLRHLRYLFAFVCITRQGTVKSGVIKHFTVAAMICATYELFLYFCIVTYE